MNENLRYAGTKNSLGVPLLRQYELEDAAAALVYQYDKSYLKTARPFDAEHFARKFLNTDLSCMYVREEDFTFGAIIYDDQRFRALNESKIARRGDIIIERKIVDSCDMKMYRYAIIHMFAHWYLHSPPKFDDSQLIFDLSTTTSVNHHVCGLSDLLNHLELNEKEGQADYFASAILMPKNLFKVFVVQHLKDNGINRANLTEGELELLLNALSESFSVPKIFVLNRLKKLNFI